VGRAFAVGFALGGIQGSDTVASIVSILKQSQPEEYPGYAAALRLAPNPAIDPALRELFTHANTGLVRLALEVLGVRGTLTSGDVQLLLEVSDGELQILLARALASNLPDDLAIAHLERMLWSNDDSLYCAAVESLLRRGHSPAREVLRECLRGSCSMRRYSTAAWYLCLAGTPNDAELLVDATRNIEREIPEQLVRVVRGLGRFGHAGVVPLLMLLLTSGDAEVASAAADSLEQIAGSGQLETVEVAWAITLPEPVQDREFPIPKRSVKRVTSDPATWNNWWRGNAQRFTSTIKYRHGRPFLPATVLDEVSKKGITCAVRDEAALELALMCGVAGHLDTRDWVARQQLRVESITESLRYLPTKPGAWHFGKTYNLAEPEVTGKYRGYP
jgi:HEAT repeat protein